MARAYTIATVAVALDVERKWLDNVLTHYRIPGSTRNKQGVSRRLSSQTVLTLRVALSLTEALGVPISRSIDLATKLVEGEGSYIGPDRVSVTVDLAAVQNLVAGRLAAAVEVAPVPLRGRPSQSKTGRLY